MVVEYLLLLLISVVIILAPFTQEGKGPINMFKINGGNLAVQLVAPRLESGKGICDHINNSYRGNPCQWR